jgi:hypothetical protein
LVTPLSEWLLNSPKNLFDPGQVLNAYNRLPLEIRAKKTNGNETIEIPFEGALCFTQNDYPFVTEPEQERVIDLRFEDGSLNTKSDSFKYLISLSPSQLAGIGDFILKNRLFFEERLLKTIEEAKDKMMADSIKNRIAVNHSIPYAGLHTLAILAKHNKEPISATFQNVKKIAQHKIRTSGTQLDLADYFFSLVDRMPEGGMTGIYRTDSSLFINVPSVLKYIKEQYTDTLTKEALFTQLRSHERFIKANFTKQVEWDSDKRIVKVWEFRLPKDPIQAEDIIEIALDHAEMFFDAIESLSAIDGVVKGKDGDHCIYIAMTRSLETLRENKRIRVSDEKLFEELRKHPRFVKTYREKTDPALIGNCWVFEK